MIRRSLPLLAVALLAPLATSAQHALPRSAEIDAYLQSAVDVKHVPGVVAMVADADRVLYAGAFGRQDDGRNVPMAVDSIFRLASMTKPVTSVAVMMLVEEGKLSLDDPIGRYFPELANATVFETFNPADKTFTKRPAKGPITIRHLLTHTSGLGYAFSSPILAALIGGDPNASATGYPLLHDPGTKWTYGESTRVLGKLVEQVSKQPLDRFVEARILKPLGMTDTFYSVPDGKHDRVATIHRTTAAGLVEDANPAKIDAPVYGDGGLHSTAADYVKFMQMFLHGGVAPDGTRLLAAKTIEMMGENQIGAVRVEQQPTANPLVSRPFPLGAGRDTFGLGFQLTGAHGDPHSRSAGSMSWAGIFNTEFWIDPQRKLCGVLLMQYLPFYDPAAIDTLVGFERLVY